MIGIKNIDIYYTGEQINVLDLPEVNCLNELELEYLKNSGIKYIYDSKQISSYELAREACKKLLAKQKEKIDYIIFIKSRVPDSFVSSEATRLKMDLKIDSDVFTISDLGCVDSSVAIKLAKDILLANDKVNNVLIAYGSKQYTSKRFRYPVTIIGDLGIACLIGRTDEHNIVDVEIETNGRYWDLFKVDFKDQKYTNYTEHCRNTREYAFELAIESKNRFTNINNKIFRKRIASYTDVSTFIMQNISLSAFYYYQQLFDIKFSDECFSNLAAYGHNGAADILLNYYSLLTTNKLNKSDLILIMNNSPVAAWATILIKV